MWIIVTVTIFQLTSGFQWSFTTNIPAHLFVLLSPYAPRKFASWKNIRGVRAFCGYDYRFWTWFCTEQDEPGDSITHTFSVSSVDIQSMWPMDWPWTRKTIYFFVANSCSYADGVQTSPPFEAPLLMPTARARRTFDQTIPRVAVTPVQWQLIEYDTGAIFDLPSDPTLLTAPISGIYAAGFHVEWATASGTIRVLRIVRQSDGRSMAEQSLQSSSIPGTPNLTVHSIFYLDAGDSIQMSVYHNAPGALAITADPHEPPQAWMHFLEAL